MPDRTVQSSWWCTTNLGWQMTVRGSQGTPYVVKWERIYDHRITQADYGYTCECKAFEFHPSRECKHIIEAKGKRCAWNEEMATCCVPDSRADQHSCPSCGGTVVSFTVNT
jgi:hypothetical protein